VLRCYAYDFRNSEFPYVATQKGIPRSENRGIPYWVGVRQSYCPMMALIAGPSRIAATRATKSLSSEM